MILRLLAARISAGLRLYERDSPLTYVAIEILGVVLVKAILGYA